MTEELGVERSSDWKKFLRKHWKMVAVFAVAGILVFVGAIYVFLWFTADAQTTGLVPTTLGLWTMGNTVSFILHLIFWELIFIGVPAFVGAVIGWQWWKKLPEQEKNEYHLSGKSSRSSMITILIGIVAIAAIPATIGLIWWIRYEMNKTP